jgi:PEP-CTERM motif
MTRLTKLSLAFFAASSLAAAVTAAPVYFTADAILPAGIADLQTKRTEWAAGAGTLTQNGFEAPFAAGSVVNFVDFSMALISGGGSFSTISNNNLITTEGTDVISFSTTGSTSVIFSFANSINAFGVDITSIDFAPTTVSFYDNIGNELSAFNTFPGWAGATFFGVNNDEGFNSVVFSFTGSEILNFDNLQYGASAPAAVPEPGTLAFMGLGLVGLGLVRGRKKTK